MRPSFVCETNGMFKVYIVVNVWAQPRYFIACSRNDSVTGWCVVPLQLFFCSEHCLFSRCKVVILFPCKRLFCVRVLCKELRWVPSWTGASIVVTIRCRVAFKSNAVVRGTKSPRGFCACVPPAFLGYVFKLLFQCFSCNTRHGDLCHRA